MSADVVSGLYHLPGSDVYELRKKQVVSVDW